MMTPLITYALLLVVASVTASPVVRSDYAVRETHPIPSQWTKISSAPADHVLKVSIALKQGNFDKLEQKLYEGRNRLCSTIFTTSLLIAHSIRSR